MNFNESMAPKIKHTGKGKKVDNRFVNEAARKRYEEVIKQKDKGFIPERGLTAKQAMDWSRGRNWAMFMSAPEEPAVEPLVREFYANFPERQDDIVFVRGEDVPFSAQEINKFYDLPEIFTDQYGEFKRTSRNDDIILSAIAKPGVAWEVSRKQKKTLKGTQLTPMARLWRYFICAKLMPETHYSTVTHEKAELLYSIATRKSMDVGDIIYESIRTASTKGRSSYCFPHLILPCAKKRGSRLQMMSRVFIRLQF